MRICYFGIYKSSYTRNRVNIDGMRLAGAEVLECSHREGGWRRYLRLWRDGWRLRHRYDVLVVGFPGHTVMPLAWLLGRCCRKPVVFDAFVSLYDSIILDRQQYSSRSIQALRYFALDWLACRLADRVVLDAQAHCEYFARTFGVPPRKLRRIFVGCDEGTMRPQSPPKPHAGLLVHFHGTYIPTQGIPTILQAAKLLENEGVQFQIVGKLSTYGAALAQTKSLQITNVTFVDYLPYGELAERMANADVCLGMFGATERAKRAGAFKIVEALAMGRVVISADEPATRELLTSGESALLCRTADPEDLARAIRQLRDDPVLRQRLAAAGRRLFESRLSTRSIGQEWFSLVNELLTA